MLKNFLNFLFRPWIPCERVTSGVATIETNHANIHEKNAFELSGTMDIAAGQVGAIKLHVPEGAYVHFQTSEFSADAGPVSISLLEDYTFTEVAEAHLVPTCLHRIDPPASIFDPTAFANITAEIGAAGVTLRTLLIPATSQGSAQRLGATGGVPNELILKPGTTYLVVMSNAGASTAKVGYYLFWYEEKDA